MVGKVKRTIAIAIIICITVVSSLTVTLCGGTLTQNRLGTGACSFTQDTFNGFASFNQFQLELTSIFIIVLLTLCVVAIGFVYNKFKAKR